MKIRMFEVVDNGNVELFFDGLMYEENFNLILGKFTKINGVEVIKQIEEDSSKACLMRKGELRFALVYNADLFVWSYVYAVEKNDHKLLKELCCSFAESLN